MLIKCPPFSHKSVLCNSPFCIKLLYAVRHTADQSCSKCAENPDKLLCFPDASSMVTVSYRVGRQRRIPRRRGDLLRYYIDFRQYFCYYIKLGYIIIQQHVSGYGKTGIRRITGQDPVLFGMFTRRTRPAAEPNGNRHTGPDEPDSRKKARKKHGGERSNIIPKKSDG